MITEVNETGIAAAAYVHSVSWRQSHSAFCTPEFIALHTPAHQEEYLKRKLESGTRVFVYLDADEAQGVVSVTGNLIEDLYVLPEKQNRGIGSLLLEHAIGICTGKPLLWILENNKGAKRLYTRRGFKPTGRKNAITDALDEIEFELEREETL